MPTRARPRSSRCGSAEARGGEALDLALDRRAIGRPDRIRPPRQAGGERLEALEALAVEAAQREERLGMVVDAQRQERVVLGRDDQQRRGLLAALVAAGGVARVERGEPALGDR